MHLSVIVQQGQHRWAPSVPALPVAKFIFVRKSTKNPPISTASCPFFPLQALPASSQHAASAIAPRCITHRTTLHRPPHRTAPNAASLPTVCPTPPSTPFHHPAALSPAPSSHPPQCPSAHAPWHFLRFRSLLCPHFPSRAQYIYNVLETKLHIFQKKRSQRFANMPNRPTFAIAKRKQGLPSEAEHSRKHIGRLAQLVQSVCLTSRGSAVRIRQRPQEIRWNGSLAQLNRAFDYGSKGYRFESYRSHTRVQASSYWVDTRVAKWGRL